MNSFISKQILTSQTIGECLRKAREGASFSVADVSLRIGIKERYLSAIEIGLYSELPGEVYALEFIKKYAGFLRMDSIKAGEAYKKERKELVARNYHLSAHGDSYRAFKHFGRFSRVLLSIAAAAIAGYAIIIGHDFFSPPVISITAPEQFFHPASSQITLQGAAKYAREVRLNGEAITIAKDGSFIESFNVPMGMTILRIDAKSRIGKTATEYRAIVMEEQEARTLVLKNIKQ